MRAIGHCTVDALVDAIASVESQPVLRRASAPELRARLDGPPPAGGRPYDEVLAQVFADVVPYSAHVGAGGYMAFIPGFPTWPSAMGDLIASALMLDACWWVGGAGGSQLELTVLRWFAEWLGYPETASGILVSGGSAANMTALACARERLVGAMRDDLVVYVSSQSHSSIARAARALGFRPGQVRVLPVDRSHRLRVDVLEQAIAADRAAERLPLAVCANAGATNTGAVDPLNELADACAAHDVWLHVDGAYGAFAALTERGRETLRGIGRADSITLDPHNGEAGRPAEDPGADDTPGRTGKGGPDGLDAGPGRGDVALVRLHDAQVRSADAAVELAEVAVHDGHEIGVDGGRRGPFELAVLGQEPARDGEEQARLLELPGHDLLVRRVGVGVEETDGDGFGARAA